MPTKPYLGVDATPFIDIAIKSGRPMSGREKRVCFTSCTVDPITLETLNGLANGFVVSRGKILDALAVFAVRHGFAAYFLAAKKQQAGKATTPPPARLPMPKPHSAAAARSVKSKPVSSSSSRHEY